MHMQDNDVEVEDVCYTASAMPLVNLVKIPENVGPICDVFGFEDRFNKEKCVQIVKYACQMWPAFVTMYPELKQTELHRLLVIILDRWQTALDRGETNNLCMGMGIIMDKDYTDARHKFLTTVDREMTNEALKAVFPKWAETAEGWNCHSCDVAIAYNKPRRCPKKDLWLNLAFLRLRFCGALRNFAC